MRRGSFSCAVRKNAWSPMGSTLHEPVADLSSVIVLASTERDDASFCRCVQAIHSLDRWRRPVASIRSRGVPTVADVARGFITNPVQRDACLSAIMATADVETSR